MKIPHTGFVHMVIFFNDNRYWAALLFFSFLISITSCDARSNHSNDTCSDDNCCYIAEGGDSGGNLGRSDSMLFGFMTGFLACLHLNQLCARSSAIFHVRSLFFSNLLLRKLHEVTHSIAWLSALLDSVWYFGSMADIVCTQLSSLRSVVSPAGSPWR